MEVLNAILGQDCTDTLISQHPTSHSTPCPLHSTLMFTRLVSLLITLLGSLLKLPQFASILAQPQHQTQYMLLGPLVAEVGSQVVCLAYMRRKGVVLGAWGEVPMVLCQNVVIVGWVLAYRGIKSSKSGGGGGGSSGSGAKSKTEESGPVWVRAWIWWAWIWMMYQWTEHQSLPRLEFLMAYIAPCLLPFMSVPLIVNNYRNKHTLGLPVGMLLIGLLMAAGRLLTSVVEVGWEGRVLVGPVWGICVGCVLLFQHVYYRHAPHTKPN